MDADASVVAVQRQARVAPSPGNQVPLIGGHGLHAREVAPMHADARRNRARVAALTRHHPDDPATIELARDFKAERLAEHIERVVAAAPPLTAEQLWRLVALLGGQQQ